MGRRVCLCQKTSHDRTDLCQKTSRLVSEHESLVSEDESACIRTRVPRSKDSGFPFQPKSVAEPRNGPQEPSLRGGSLPPACVERRIAPAFRVSLRAPVLMRQSHSCVRRRIVRRARTAARLYRAAGVFLLDARRFSGLEWPCYATLARFARPPLFAAGAGVLLVVLPPMIPPIGGGRPGRVSGVGVRSRGHPGRMN